MDGGAICLNRNFEMSKVRRVTSISNFILSSFV